jgi:hypothetical protein
MRHTRQHHVASQLGTIIGGLVSTAFAQEFAAANAPHSKTKATVAFNAKVRHPMSVKDIAFEFVNNKVMAEELDPERQSKA